MGGYQYAGKSYDARLAHVDGINKCIDCHDSHSLEVKVDKCATCHEGVVTVADLQGVRSMGSLMDYDGDGNVVEGIASEIDGLRDILYGAMQAYGTAMGAPIAYDGHAYPYFFADTNGNGVVDEGEGGYSSFTARMLKAAYNYQVSVKDPGAFAHNGKYLIQLLYDTIEDLDPALVVGLTRDDAGHFNGSAEAFRHWDGDGTVPGSCSKCHSPAGLPFYLAEGVTVSQTVGNGLTCTTCHSSLIDFARREVATVAFPSGAVLDTGDPDSNLCISCHQGRESTVSVDAAIAGLDLDTPSAALRFINVHYFAAGATRFGTEAMGAYEYMGQTYKGLFTHTSSRDTCTECHDAHMGEVLVQSCIKCHKNIQTTADIRRSSTDYDGDGNVAEGIAGEIETMQAFLLAAIQNYAATVAGTPIMYDANRYPYFMTETGGTYKAFTPRLLQATYNYQYSVKDPGAFAHNANYVLQTLYDSAADLGADMSGKIRP
jgi:hypothetical protein